MSNKRTLKHMKSIVPHRYDPIVLHFSATDGETIEVTLDYNIGLLEESAFIDAVVDGVFTTDGDFIPEYRDVMTFISVIQHLSDIPIPKEKSGNIDLGTCYEWLQATNILGMMRGNGEPTISKDHFNWLSRIEDMISEKIEFQKQAVIARRQSDCGDFMEQLTPLMEASSALGEKYAELDLDEMMELARSIAGKREQEFAPGVIDVSDAPSAGKNPVKK